jgi:hypothetical protein
MGEAILLWPVSETRMGPSRFCEGATIRENRRFAKQDWPSSFDGGVGLCVLVCRSLFASQCCVLVRCLALGG